MTKKEILRVVNRDIGVSGGSDKRSCSRCTRNSTDIERASAPVRNVGLAEQTGTLLIIP